MKLKHTVLRTLACLVVLVAVLVPSQAFAQSGKYVFDQYNLLSPEVFSELETEAANYADEYGVGVYLLTTDYMNSYSPSSSQRNEFARDYYESHNLGEGSGKGGIIFVIAVDSRDYVTVKHFANSADDPFSDDCVDKMEDAVVDCLSDDNWAAGCKAYYQIVGEQLDYFAINGEQWTKPHIMASLIKIAATLLIPLFVAIGVVSSEKNAMLTAKLKTEASNYLEPNSFYLRVSTDTFINSTMTVTPIPKDDDKKGGGGWSSMGGGYSGSGGGKF